ncbi:hypothetical protein Tco_1251803 [Tanacetum coccineum]
MMNNLRTRLLPRMTSLRNLRDLQILILIGIRELLVGPAFNLLKGTCKSLTKLEYHFEECSKAITERLDWHNPEGKPYPFDLRKPLPLIPNHRVTRLKIMNRYNYGHLDDIEVRREDKQLYMFKEDEHFDLNVALHMFTKRIVIQRRVEDLQLGVESYQKKLYLTKPDTFRLNLKNRTTYIAYSDPQGVIYKDQNNRNKLMHADELHKFSDDTLNDVWTTLHDIALGIRMEYLPKRKWSGLDKQRARVMIQDIDNQSQRDLPRDIPLVSIEVHRQSSWTSDVMHNPPQPLKGVISVRRPSRRRTSLKNSILSHSKIHPENVEVQVRKNKKTNVISDVNVVKTKDHVENVNAENALKANVNVMCVLCHKNMLISCHDKCLSNYKLFVNFKVKRALFTSPKAAKSKFLDTTHIIAKTRFVVVNPLNAKDKDSSASLTTSLSKQVRTLSNYMHIKEKTSRKW